MPFSEYEKIYKNVKDNQPNKKNLPTDTSHLENVGNTVLFHAKLPTEIKRQKDEKALVEHINKNIPMVKAIIKELQTDFTTLVSKSTGEDKKTAELIGLEIEKYIRVLEKFVNDAGELSQLIKAGLSEILPNADEEGIPELDVKPEEIEEVSEFELEPIASGLQESELDKIKPEDIARLVNEINLSSTLALSLRNYEEGEIKDLGKVAADIENIYKKLLLISGIKKLSHIGAGLLVQKIIEQALSQTNRRSDQRLPYKLAEKVFEIINF